MLFLLIFVAVAVCFKFGVFGERSMRVLREVMRPALWLGGIGFALGFFGPMIFTPGANQGPMLGIFITGPAGFVLGLAVGVVRALRPS